MAGMSPKGRTARHRARRGGGRVSVAVAVAATLGGAVAARGALPLWRETDVRVPWSAWAALALVSVGAHAPSADAP